MSVLRRYRKKQFARIVKCVCCGLEFDAYSNSARYCPACKSTVASVRYRWRRDHETNKTDADLCAEVRRIRSGQNSYGYEQHNCPRCGKITTRKKYCTQCIATGLYRIHQVTGRTTGWDRKSYGVGRINKDDNRLTKGLTLKRMVNVIN